MVNLLPNVNAYQRVHKYINDPFLMPDLHWMNTDGSGEQKPQQQVYNKVKSKEHTYNLIQ